ncbi:hypothetical protein Pelo_4755 [Pelomyxa schiedti]|nr:hypothetical protein Pelo_4755 [Pelomyxa schiedti]
MQQDLVQTQYGGNLDCCCQQDIIYAQQDPTETCFTGGEQVVGLNAGVGQMTQMTFSSGEASGDGNTYSTTMTMTNITTSTTNQEAAMANAPVPTDTSNLASLPSNCLSQQNIPITGETLPKEQAVIQKEIETLESSQCQWVTEVSPETVQAASEAINVLLDDFHKLMEITNGDSYVPLVPVNFNEVTSLIGDGLKFEQVPEHMRSSVVPKVIERIRQDSNLIKLLYSEWMHIIQESGNQCLMLGNMINAQLSQCNTVHSNCASLLHLSTTATSPQSGGGTPPSSSPDAQVTPAFTENSSSASALMGQDSSAAIPGKQLRKRLPKAAVEEMKAWISGHTGQPCAPFAIEFRIHKVQIAVRYRISRAQVDNWFVNARRRMLKRQHKR